MRTTIDDIMSISEELNSLDNINRKLELLESLVGHIFTVTNKIISSVELHDGNAFKEIKKTGLRIINVNIRISTAIEIIKLNPEKLYENSEVIVSSTEEITTLIHHLDTVSLKEECKKSKRQFNTKSVNEKIETGEVFEHTTDLENESKKQGKHVTFEDKVTIYEYNEESEISSSTPIVRKCTLNDEEQGFCLNEELVSEDVSGGLCKSYHQSLLKTLSNTHHSYNSDTGIYSGNTEDLQSTTDITNNEEDYSNSRKHKTGSNNINVEKFLSDKYNSREQLINDGLLSNPVLSTTDQCSSHDAGNDFSHDRHGNQPVKTLNRRRQSCRKEDIFFGSYNRQDFKHNARYMRDYGLCNSFEYSQEYMSSSERSPKAEKYEIPATYEESLTTENTITPISDGVSADNTEGNTNAHFEYHFEEIPTNATGTITTTTQQPSTYDILEDSEPSVSTEDHTTTETYDDSTTTEQSSVHNDYGYSNDYACTEEITTTEGYGYSYDSFTTEKPSYYSTDSYYWSTTTEQMETTTERDLSTLSQNIYAVAQDLSTKAQEISTVTSEISSKASEISSALSDINTDDQDMQNKIQELSKLTQEISSKTSEISTLSSETSRLSSDISTASNDIPNVNNKDHPHRISPRQRISSKSQDLITSTQNIITAAQDIIVKIQDISFRSYDLKPADMISTASHDITSRTQGIITEALDIVTAALEIMTSVDF